jgi:hypothetical protein
VADEGPITEFRPPWKVAALTALVAIAATGAVTLFGLVGDAIGDAVRDAGDVADAGRDPNAVAAPDDGEGAGDGDGVVRPIDRPVPEGWQRVELDGFSFSMPGEWQRLPVAAMPNGLRIVATTSDAGGVLVAMVSDQDLSTVLRTGAASDFVGIVLAPPSSSAIERIRVPAGLAVVIGGGDGDAGATTVVVETGHVLTFIDPPPREVIETVASSLRVGGA